MSLLTALCGLPQDLHIVAFIGPGPVPAPLHRLAAEAGPQRFELVPLRHAAFDPRAFLAWSGVVRRAGIDLFHSPYHVWSPVRMPCPVAATVHDLIIDHYPSLLPIPPLWPGYKLLSRRALAGADALVAVSAATRQEVVTACPAAAGRIGVIHPGVDEMFFAEPSDAAREAVRSRYGLPRHFLLAVGNGRIHKNIDRLIRAYSALPDVRGHALVLLGRDRARSRGRVGRLPLPNGGEILDLPRCEDDDLPALYRLATALVQPSLAEGFGLPVAESMAAGCPVACSAIDSLAEVSDGAALLFDPLDEAALAAALGRLIADASLRAELGALGRARAAALSWRRSAERLAALYGRLARGNADDSGRW